jgi:hypothetical protein
MIRYAMAMEPLVITSLPSVFVIEKLYLPTRRKCICVDSCTVGSEFSGRLHASQAYDIQTITVIQD